MRGREPLIFRLLPLNCPSSTHLIAQSSCSPWLLEARQQLLSSTKTAFPTSTLSLCDLATPSTPHGAYTEKKTNWELSTGSPTNESPRQQRTKSRLVLGTFLSSLNDSPVIYHIHYIHSTYLPFLLVSCLTSKICIDRISLNWPLSAQAQAPKIDKDSDSDSESVGFFNRKLFHQDLFAKPPRCVNDDVWTFNTQVSSQWDGLRHYAYQKERLFYNGVTMEEIHEDGGSGVNGVQGEFFFPVLSSSSLLFSSLLGTTLQVFRLGWFGFPPPTTAGLISDWMDDKRKFLWLGR